MFYKQIQKVTKSIIRIVGLTSLLVFLFGSVAFAAPRPVLCADGQTVYISDEKNEESDFEAACRAPVDHGGYNPAASTTIPAPDAKPKDCNEANLDRDNCGIIRYLVLFINVLSAIVGIVVAAVIIWGGIEYSTSTGDPAKVQAAKKKIYDGILSLVAFIFTYAFLQYIVPGGVL